MSRTFRRTQPHLIRQWLGSREEAERDGWWLMRRYPTCTFDQAYDKARARHLRDHPRGRFSPPRAFRRRFGSKLVRCREAAKLHRGLRSGEWDDHLSESRTRDAKWRWF